MKVASWNVNSLRVRLPQVLDWLESSQADILGLQETKTQDIEFPLDALHEAGFQVLYSGQKTYNGVALLARTDTVIEQLGEMHDAVTDLPGLDDPSRRVMVATLGDWRIVNLYVPNGATVDSDKYQYKLSWLSSLHQFLEAELKKHSKIVVMGDFNIAPEDRDVHDPVAWEGSVLVSPKERAALAGLLELGFTDSFRQFEQEPGAYSWWDYRAAAFRMNRGLRIDLILTSQAATNGLHAGTIDRTPRTWERPSDHTPVVAEFTVL